VNPNLDANLLSEEEFEEIMKQCNSHEVWKAYFDGITAFEGKTGNMELGLRETKVVFKDVKKTGLADLKSAQDCPKNILEPSLKRE
jgi:hypothetical protein